MLDGSASAGGELILGRRESALFFKSPLSERFELFHLGDLPCGDALTLGLEALHGNESVHVDVHWRA